MANRAALLLSPAPPPDAVREARPAYGADYVTPPFWYAALDEAALDGWEACWQRLAAEAPAEEDYAAAILWLPWPAAEARLRAAAEAARARGEPWAAAFEAWRQALSALAARDRVRWLGLELMQIFAMHEEPAAMLAEARAGIALFAGRGQDPRWIELPEDPLRLGGRPEAIGQDPPPPAAPGPRPVLRPLLHLLWAALITYGIWAMSGTAWVTAGIGLLLLYGLWRLHGPGGRG
ncbi:hypothetical protein [Pseudoroseomonas cervicalis]|uniref:hypothetical protein n=1 Tax=Teichococcus cervicalis TaxID=204525 RepID=UPI0022F191F6|nr:hypothetical protein [Pseudoroseomonas cervicalis]WBV45201.1 hypothetical protein PFY06_19355 [Pseudoroseomonas cervicalis]